MYAKKQMVILFFLYLYLQQNKFGFIKKNEYRTQNFGELDYFNKVKISKKAF